MKSSLRIGSIAIALIASTLLLSSSFHYAAAQPISGNVSGNVNMSTPKNPILVSPPSGTINPFANITTSIPVFSTLIKALRSEIHVSLNDATTNAMKAVGSNSSAVSGSIQSTGGFLAYTIIVLDSGSNIHIVVVDPGNGKVVSNKQLPAGILGTSIMGLPPSIGGGFIPSGGGFANFPFGGLIR